MMQRDRSVGFNKFDVDLEFIIVVKLYTCFVCIFKF